MRVFGILSDHRAFWSKSPLMHNAVLKRHGIEGIYLPFCVADARLADAVKGIRALNITGVNVTVPYKESVVPFLDCCSEEATAVGAVNTILNRDDKLIGENTDVGGFVDALESAGYHLTGKTALVIGTGGAAKAVLRGLKKMGANMILVTGRDAGKARKLAWQLDCLDVTFEQLRAHDDVSADLVVNATTISVPGEDPLMDDLAGKSHIVECEFVFDINYGREINLWQDFAETHGARFMDGISMLAHQAKRSFCLWTGVDASAEEFLEALKENA